MIAPPAAATLGTAQHLDGRQWISRLGEGRVFMMGDNPLLPPMPARPTLADFFRLRLAQEPFTAQHLIHSARKARTLGLDDDVVVACLLHDIAIGGLLRSHHGHWGAQLVAPYVSEEVAWAIRQHEILRFFPDPSVGYDYPQTYETFFGPDYQPPEHVHRAYREARAHPWYMTARLITINDIYSFAFDPDEPTDISEFEDELGRCFRQPREGLGFDGSPVAHMWRTMIWPNNFL
ncbi:HD domain-containing protein [Kitasatospora phosalacinea]|uniref:HD domain-containing protein n=1 Tax=Kitasatospora phosalacinea TaxID=2065 RepID=UPI00364E7C8E